MPAFDGPEQFPPAFVPAEAAGALGRTMAAGPPARGHHIM